MKTTRKSAFTLTELVISIVLLAIITLVVISEFKRHERFVREAEVREKNIQSALDVMKEQHAVISQEPVQIFENWWYVSVSAQSSNINMALGFIIQKSKPEVGGFQKYSIGKDDLRDRVDNPVICAIVARAPLTNGYLVRIQ